ncbi:unnamed protein product [Caenorhabditis angaria]|uniref:Uncharacterized protein n=1 Tax=Caenorhabditis angaria TaxID=860376 RepID=A0A9P1N750_9PELO|nr:unnamed protein product [Caenorhabditis angaria]
MNMLLVFLLISQVFSTLIYKREVPFDFLATRTRPVTQFYEFSGFFGPTIQAAYDKYCAGPKLRCYFPIAKQNDILVYTMLTETPNYNCSSYPYCIGFNQSQYLNYSIVFSDTDVLPEDFILPNCTTSQFSFTRPNGLNWCFNITRVELTHKKAEIQCSSQNASLNGFQTIEEQEYFIEKYVEVNVDPQNLVHLNAVRICYGETRCNDTDGILRELSWTSAIVSTNQTLANNRPSYLLDGSGNYLLMTIINGEYLYDDTGDKTTGFYSCGWYAK